jgi:chemotaxis protein CheD
VTTEDIMQATVLGSCVSACIRDVRLGIGGMNHFMLPEGDGSGPVSGAARYGTYAMETLIGHLLRLGARRDRLEAKVFGGGSVLTGLTLANIGQRNAAFVLEYLKGQGIRVAAQDLEDVHPRKVHFYPATGRVLVKRLRTLANSTIADREYAYRQRLLKPAGGKVELLD